MTDTTIDVVTASAVPASEPVATPPSSADVNPPVEAEKVGEAAAPQNDQTTDKAAPDPEPSDQEPRKPRGVQKRIDELTREKNEWKRLAEMALQGKQPANDQPQARGKEGPPQVEDFQDWDEYNRAVARYEAKQEMQAERMREEETRARESKVKAFNDFQAKAEKLAERIPNIADAIAWASQDNIPLSPDAGEFIVEHSERGPEVLHFLANNPQEVQRLAQMRPAAQIRALTLIEQKLPSLEPKRVTSANPPPNTIQAKAEVTKSPSEMNEEEYQVWFNERQRNRRR